MPEYYKIKIKGYPDPRWSEGFPDFKVQYLKGHEILLSGLPPAQVSIYGILERIHNFNLTLISVTRTCPSSHTSDKE